MLRDEGIEMYVIDNRYLRPSTIAMLHAKRLTKPLIIQLQIVESTVPCPRYKDRAVTKRLQLQLDATNNSDNCTACNMRLSVSALSVVDNRLYKQSYIPP